MQYRLGGRDARKERVTLGEYPAHTIAQARLSGEQRREILQWWADLVNAQIEEGRKVVIGRFEKAFHAA